MAATSETLEDAPEMELHTESFILPDDGNTSDQKLQGRFECKFCFRRFNQKQTLKQHILTHTGQRPFECNVCFKTFTQQGALQRHMAIHTGEKPFPCTICELTFRQKIGLNRHMARHNGASSERFPCPFCNRSFARKDNQLRHAATHSSNRERFFCQFCRKAFLTEKSWLRHQEKEKLRIVNAERITEPSDVSSSQDAEKTIRCTICDGKFMRQKINQGLDEFFCLKCLPSQNRDNIGVEVPIYECTSCDYTTQCDEELKIHARVHDARYQHVCSLCTHRFKANYLLRQHVENHHSSEKTCQLCQMTFANEVQLKVHYALHTDMPELGKYVKLYECCNCNQVFTVRRKIIYHLKKHERKCQNIKRKCKSNNEERPVLVLDVKNIQSTSSESKFKMEDANSLTMDEDNLDSFIIEKVLREKLVSVNNSDGELFSNHSYKEKQTESDRDIKEQDGYNLENDIKMNPDDTNTLFEKDEPLTVFVQPIQGIVRVIANDRIVLTDGMEQIIGITKAAITDDEIISSKMETTVKQEENLCQQNSLQTLDNYGETIDSACSEIEQLVNVETFDYGEPIDSAYCKTETLESEEATDNAYSEMVEDSQSIVTEEHYRSNSETDDAEENGDNNSSLYSEPLTKATLKETNVNESFTKFVDTTFTNSRNELPRDFHSENRSDDIHDGSKDIKVKKEEIETKFVEPKIEFVVLDNFDEEDVDDMIDDDDKSEVAPNPYFCYVCKHRYWSKHSLRRHFRVKHTNIVKQTNVCELCGKTLQSKDSLNKHVKAIHTPHRFRCKECGKTFNRLDGLTSHALVHTGQKLYRCELCDKRFTQKQTLHAHMQRHTGSPKHSCAVCNKSFYVAGSLTRHELTHSDIRPFKCHLCDLSFRQKNHLEKHYIVHEEITKKQSFACYKCDRVFYRKASYQRHMERHNPDREMFICGGCGKKYKTYPFLEKHLATCKEGKDARGVTDDSDEDYC